MLLFVVHNLGRGSAVLFDCAMESDADGTPELEVRRTSGNTRRDTIVAGFRRVGAQAGMIWMNDNSFGRFCLPPHPADDDILDQWKEQVNRRAPRLPRQGDKDREEGDKGNDQGAGAHLPDKTGGHSRFNQAVFPRGVLPLQEHPHPECKKVQLEWDLTEGDIRKSTRKGGGERKEGDEHEGPHIEPDIRPVQATHGMELDMVAKPECPEDQEGQHIMEKIRVQREEKVRDEGC